MYRNKPVIVKRRPWWRHPVFPWGWYSLSQDRLASNSIHTEGFYRPGDGSGGTWVWSPYPASVMGDDGCFEFTRDE